MSGCCNKLKSFFQPNSSNRSGTIDVIVSEDRCGCLKFTEFHVRVSKLRLLYPQNKTMQVLINEQPTSYEMKISNDGLGYFEYQIYDDETDETDENLGKKSASLDKSETKIDLMDQEIFEPSTRVIQERAPVNLKPLSKVGSLTRVPRDRAVFRKSATIRELAMGRQNSIQISLCAHLINGHLTVDEISSIFNENIVDQRKFRENPQAILNDANLMIKINGKIYDSYVGLPQLFSKLAYGNELTNLELATLMDNGFQHPSPQVQPFSYKKLQARLKKSLKPPSDFFDDIELIPGLNTIEYRFTGNFGKQVSIYARLFYYPYQQQYRILISDVDGTITRSDILGHLMPFIYHDWSQIGIAEFFAKLRERGYIIMYLSSRNVDLSSYTLNYLQSVKQGGYRLPDGPVLVSPDNIFKTLKRELIDKNPETFKIAKLREISQIFSHSAVNPLYAGFGNKDSDAVSYMVVGIPKNRIFTINCEGEIYVLKSPKVFSYSHLHQNINEIFPEFNPDIAEHNHQLYGLNQACHLCGNINLGDSS